MDTLDLDLPKKRKIVVDAAFYKRVLAFLIDLFIINIVISSTFSMDLEDQEFDEFTEYVQYLEENQDVLVGAGSAMMILSYVYFILFEILLGQTPGKMLFKIRIVSTEKKKKIKFWQILVRNLFMLYSIFWVIWIIDAVHLIVGKMRFSDKIARTKAIEEIYQ